MKKIVYIDMDDTICDYTNHHNSRKLDNPRIQFPQSQYGFYLDIPLIDIDTKFLFEVLSHHYDVWIATRPSIINAQCYTEKRYWVEKYLGKEWCEKLILIPNKALLIGDYLIDDKPWPEFKGQQLLITDKYTLKSAVTYLIKQLKE